MPLRSVHNQVKLAANAAQVAIFAKGQLISGKKRLNQNKGVVLNDILLRFEKSRNALPQSRVTQSL